MDSVHELYYEWKCPNELTSHTFTTTSGQSAQGTFQSEGGQGTINASCTAPNGQVVNASPINVYVYGSSINNDSITAQLVTAYQAYSGTTPHLMTGIATVESTYAQFANRTLYNISARWPVESPTANSGVYIGLMQVTTQMSTAFDWINNAWTGTAWFAGPKMNYAKQFNQVVKSGNPGLADLTPAQLEMVALEFYGPQAGNCVPMSNWWCYYAPNSNGTAWVKVSDTTVTSYADSVYGAMK